MRFYIKNGGDGLTIQKIFTSDANGQVSLGLTGGDEPGFISNVSMRRNSGNAYWSPCKATRADEVEYPHGSAAEIRVNYVPKPYFDSSNGELILFGDAGVGTSPMDLPELDALIALYAARTMITRDAEQNFALNDAIMQAEIAIGATFSTPLAVEFPRYGMSLQVAQSYRWAFIPFDHATQNRNVIQIHRPLYSFFNVIN
jgi:hypothetical protein